MNDMRLFKVTKKTCVTPELCRIWMEPADSQPVFEFRAGQFVMVHELDDEDQSLNNRSYSIASAPYESKNAIELGIKSQGKMSGLLYSTKVGDVLGVQGPYGVFALPEQPGPVVLFAGGVGATPVRAMARELLHADPAAKVALFYSGRTLADLMYHDEYVKLAKSHPNFKYVPVVTRECPEDFAGECGRLDAAKIKRHLTETTDVISFICGPQEFMDNAKAILTGMGMTPKQLRTERY